MKKLIPLFAIAFLALALLPFVADAARLIPCGGFELDAKGDYIDKQPLQTPVPQGLGKINDSQMAKLQPPCGLCHVFVLGGNIINFFLYPDRSGLNKGFAIVPIVATILIVVGGFLLMTAAGDPEKLGKAKSVLTAVVIGLIIIYASWLFLETLFTAIGVIPSFSLKDWGNTTSWCPV